MTTYLHPNSRAGNISRRVVLAVPNISSLDRSLAIRQKISALYLAEKEIIKDLK